MSARHRLLALALVAPVLGGCSTVSVPRPATSQAVRAACAPGQKRAAPAGPKATFVISVGSKAAALSAGDQTHVSVPRGQSTAITLRVQRPAGVPVADVWLAVNRTGAMQFGPNGLHGRFTLLAHHAGSLGPDDVVSTEWMPTTSAGMLLTVYAEVGDSSVGWQIAQVHVAG